MLAAGLREDSAPSVCWPSILNIKVDSWTTHFSESSLHSPQKMNPLTLLIMTCSATSRLTFLLIKWNFLDHHVSQVCAWSSSLSMMVVCRCEGGAIHHHCVYTRLSHLHAAVHLVLQIVSSPSPENNPLLCLLTVLTSLLGPCLSSSAAKPSPTPLTCHSALDHTVSPEPPEPWTCSSLPRLLLISLQ